MKRKERERLKSVNNVNENSVSVPHRSHPLLSTQLHRLLPLHLDKDGVQVRRHRAAGEGGAVRTTCHFSHIHPSSSFKSGVDCAPLFWIVLYQPVCLQSRHLEKIPCELDADGSGIRCQDTSCPYKEEQHRISLTIYIRSDAYLEAYTKAFYLREIGE